MNKILFLILFIILAMRPIAIINDEDPPKTQKKENKVNVIEKDTFIIKQEQLQKVVIKQNIKLDSLLVKQQEQKKEK